MDGHRFGGRRWRLGLLTLLLVLTACTTPAGPPASSPPATNPPATSTAAASAKPAPPTATSGSPTTPAGGATPSSAPKPVPGTPAPTSDAVQSLGNLRLTTERLVGGLEAPVHLTHAGDGSNRLFVVEKVGRIRIIRDGQLLATPFLDIRPIVGSRSSERGLLGLAFHPAYAQTGFFYVNYTDVDGHTNIVRYEVNRQQPDQADPIKAKPILKFNQPYPNHNGGLILFGPDGYLWIGTGDGGSGGDPHNNAQNGRTLLGKMLRIDVNNGDPYAIPADNPYRGDTAFRPEIWAIGLRNPWRYSFDRLTGDLYIADVGQNKYEEIHVTLARSPGPLNYGWSSMEGRHCFKPAEGCDQAGLDLPVAEYGRDKGCSVTGGHVYRGQRAPTLTGIYFYGDFCSGRLWGLARSASSQWTNRELLTLKAQISSFGEDEAGEIYITGYNTGDIYRLTTE